MCCRSSVRRRAQVALQLLSLTVMVMVYGWVKTYHEGFAWTPAQVFYYHPMLMVTSLVFLNVQSMTVYRCLGAVFSHSVTKRMHMAIHTFGVLLAWVGIYAVFHSHNLKRAANMYSLHSWIGMTAVLAYTAQYVSAVYVFYASNPHSHLCGDTIGERCVWPSLFPMAHTTTTARDFARRHHNDGSRALNDNGDAEDTDDEDASDDVRHRRLLHDDTSLCAAPLVLLLGTSRQDFLTRHVQWASYIFVAVTVAAVTGICEKVAFSGFDPAQPSTERTLLNTTAMLLMLVLFLVLYVLFPRASGDSAGGSSCPAASSASLSARRVSSSFSSLSERRTSELYNSLSLRDELAEDAL